MKKNTKFSVRILVLFLVLTLTSLNVFASSISFDRGKEIVPYTQGMVYDETVTLENKEFHLRIEDLGENRVQISVNSENGNKSQAIYDREKDTIEMNGEVFQIETEVFIKEIQEITSDIHVSNSDPWAPVYVQTIRKSIPETITELGDAAGYLADILTVFIAILVGGGVAAPAILTSIKAFASSKGIEYSALILSKIIGGYWTYDVERTSELVNTGYGKYDYMYRYANFSLTCSFVINNVTYSGFRHSSNTATYWWSSSRPY